jgi:hypothetical protein
MDTLSPHGSNPSNQHRSSCVIDPNLLLSPYGLFLVRCLGDLLELWVARELWHILENPEFYCKQGQIVIPQQELEQPPESRRVAEQQRIEMLKHWERVRSETPPAQLKLFWLGDRPGESYIPNGTDPQMMERWEAIAQSLDDRSPQSSRNTGLTVAYRDTAALAAALGSAFILTYQLSDDLNNPSPPELCLILEQWGIPCHRIDPLDAIADLERENLLQLIVATGLSKLLWAGLRLAILHLVVPSTITTCGKRLPRWTIHTLPENSVPEPPILNLWEGAQGFWYPL